MEWTTNDTAPPNIMRTILIVTILFLSQGDCHKDAGPVHEPGCNDGSRISAKKANCMTPQHRMPLLTKLPEAKQNSAHLIVWRFFGRMLSHYILQLLSSQALALEYGLGGLLECITVLAQHSLR